MKMIDTETGHEMVEVSGHDQDALIQAAITRVAEQADFNLFRRTCRMITGEVVLPNTPTVTGYPAYNPYSCPAQSAPAPAN